MFQLIQFCNPIEETWGALTAITLRIILLDYYIDENKVQEHVLECKIPSMTVWSSKVDTINSHNIVSFS